MSERSPAVPEVSPAQFAAIQAQDRAPGLRDEDAAALVSAVKGGMTLAQAVATLTAKQRPHLRPASAVLTAWTAELQRRAALGT